MTGEIPVKAPKKARTVEAKTVILLRCGELAAFRRRPPRGLLAGMWELPNAEGALTCDEASALALEWGVKPLGATPGPEAVHIFTHREWRMKSFRIECAEPGGDFRWLAKEAFEREIALPSAFRNFLVSLWR